MPTRSGLKKARHCGSALLALVLVGCVPSNVLAVVGMEFSGGSYSASIPFLAEQRGVYNVYVLHEATSNQPQQISIEGTYELRNDAAEELLAGRFQAQLSATNGQSLITAFGLTRDRAIEASALIIKIDVGGEELRNNFSRVAIQLEKRGYVVFLD